MEDRAAALVWQSEQQNKCPGCGGDLRETTHADAEGRYDGHVVRCHRCKARNTAIDRMKDDTDRTSLLVWATKEDDE